MAVTTPTNIWTPDSGDDYALTTDLAAMADTVNDAIVKRGNYGLGTTPQRNAALGDFANGAVWYDTTEEKEYRRVSGAWAPATEDTGWVTFPFASGYNSYTGFSSGYRKIGNRVFLRGLVERTGGTPMEASTLYTFGTLPVSIRPSTTGFYASGVTVGRETPTVVASGSGDIQVRVSTATILYFSLDGISWFTD